MQLPQINVVDVQTLQGRIQGAHQVTSACIQASFGVGTLHGFGGEHDVGPAFEFLDEHAEHFFADALGVTVGGVDQRAANIQEGSQLIARFKLVRLAAPRHGTEPDASHPEPGSAERSLLHSRTLLVKGPQKHVLALGWRYEIGSESGLLGCR